MVVIGAESAASSESVRSGKVFLIVLVDVPPELEDDFNSWYDEQHLPDILACPGFVRARRGRATDPEQWPRYITIYEAEDEEALESPALQAVRGWGPFEDKVQGFQRLVFRSTGPDLFQDASGSSVEVEGR